MSVRTLQGDCIEVMRTMPDESINCCVTSPPYWGLRDYGVAGQIGLESTPDEYVTKMVEVFREVRRVLRDDGTCWLNLGDSYVSTPRGNKNGWEGSGLHGVESKTYQDTLNAGTARTMDKTKIAGMKPKDLVGIPWRVAFALQADGWYLRQDIIWSKPNPMPESVRDRCTKAHEYIFLLSKSARYYYDADAVNEAATDPEYRERGKIRPTAEGGPGFEIRGGLHNQVGGRDTRNRRSVWTVCTQPYKGAHFATFPPKLIEPCILAGCPAGGTVLDPFGGSGTTGEVAAKHARNAILIELNPEYVKLARERVGLFLE